MNPNQANNNNLFGLNNFDLSQLIASSGLNLNGMNNGNVNNGSNNANNSGNAGGVGNIDMSMFQGMGLGNQGVQGPIGLGLGLPMGQQNPQQAQGNNNVSIALVVPPERAKPDRLDIRPCHMTSMPI
jgi:hypothetical protein